MCKAQKFRVEISNFYCENLGCHDESVILQNFHIKRFD